MKLAHGGRSEEIICEFENAERVMVYWDEDVGITNSRDEIIDGVDTGCMLSERRTGGKLWLWGRGVRTRQRVRFWSVVD